MALVQIQVLSGGRVTLAKESAAAKLVAAGKARYVITATTAEPDVAVEVVAAPTKTQPDSPPATKPRKGRR